jgi:antitoxin HigA-1
VVFVWVSRFFPDFSPHPSPLSQGERGPENDLFIRINDQWRICFEWHVNDPYRVEVVDCHMRPIHLGEILRKELQELGCSARELAHALGVPVNRVTGILREERSIPAATALRVVRYFTSTPEFWLNLQSAYDLRRAQHAVGKKIARAVHPRAAT